MLLTGVSKDNEVLRHTKLQIKVYKLEPPADFTRPHTTLNL